MLDASTFVNDIATAPGDLPMPEVLARLATQETQFRHDNTIVPLAPQPNQPLELWATTGTQMPLERAMVYYTIDGSEPGLEDTCIPLEIAGVRWEALPGFLTHRRATIPGQPEGTVVRYRLAGWRAGSDQAPDAPPDVWANDGQGFWFRYPGEAGITTFSYRAEPAGPVMPVWVGDGIIYQIFLDRFHPGTPDGAFPASADPQARHGGTLAGVHRALPYLADLGVTCLWLSPLCASDTYHRYDVTDYYRVDPMLGTNDDLTLLTSEAHTHGIRILLDFVPSHCSSRHPAFQAAQRNRHAPTASWFTFDKWPDRYRCFLQRTKLLPTLNTQYPGARDHLIGSALQWLRECGVDGFRIDHAIGPSFDFWVALRAAMKEAAPDSFTVGEATDTPDCLRRYRGKLDAVLDFPLARALRLFFGRGDWTVSRFDGYLTAYERYMADGPGRVTFLDNHDMNRFLFVAGNDAERLKLAALCQFTLEGTPTIYYGTEIGLSQQRDKDERGSGGDVQVRTDMPWDESSWNQDLLAFYRRLIDLRRRIPVLRDGRRRTLHVDDKTQTYAYVRTRSADTMPAAGDCVVLFNLGSEAQSIELPVELPPHEVRWFSTTGNVPPNAENRKSVCVAGRTGVVVQIG
jgi:glycosidase